MSPHLVKINAEGAAGEMLLATRARDWRMVRAVWMDLEPSDPVPEGEIEDHLRGAGFTPALRSGSRRRFDRL